MDRSGGTLGKTNAVRRKLEAHQTGCKIMESVSVDWCWMLATTGVAIEKSEKVCHPQKGAHIDLFCPKFDFLVSFLSFFLLLQ